MCPSPSPQPSSCKCSKDDEYVVKVAKSVDDAKTLLEIGYDYVTDMSDIKLFRKRKLTQTGD